MKKTLTLCFDYNVRVKEENGKGGMGKEEESITKKAALVCFGGKGRKRKIKLIFLPNLFTFGEIHPLTKLRK